MANDKRRKVTIGWQADVPLFSVQYLAHVLSGYTKFTFNLIPVSSGSQFSHSTELEPINKTRIHVSASSIDPHEAAVKTEEKYLSHK